MNQNEDTKAWQGEAVSLHARKIKPVKVDEVVDDVGIALEPSKSIARRMVSDFSTVQPFTKNSSPQSISPGKVLYESSRHCSRQENPISLRLKSFAKMRRTGES